MIRRPDKAESELWLEFARRAEVDFRSRIANGSLLVPAGVSVDASVNRLAGMLSLDLVDVVSSNVLSDSEMIRTVDGRCQLTASGFRRLLEVLPQ